MAVLIMVSSAAAVILLVKFGLLRGIDHIAEAMSWTPKTRGQVTGYATSIPELVCLVAAGLSGVWEAGLWNIASSNIINAILMLVAVLYHGKFRELFNMRFLDEVGFAALAIAVPILLMAFGSDTQWVLIPGLLGFFFVYQVVNKMLTPLEPVPEISTESVGSLRFGLILTLTTLVFIAAAGVLLGNATAVVVHEFGVHPALAGWLLGLATSVPEMVSFFAVYATAKQRSVLDLSDTQEALDNLTGSNMANVGIVYPLGLLAFLFGSTLLGAG